MFDFSYYSVMDIIHDVMVKYSIIVLHCIFGEVAMNLFPLLRLSTYDADIRKLNLFYFIHFIFTYIFSCCFQFWVVLIIVFTLYFWSTSIYFWYCIHQAYQSLILLNVFFNYILINTFHCCQLPTFWFLVLVLVNNIYKLLPFPHLPFWSTQLSNLICLLPSIPPLSTFDFIC